MKCPRCDADTVRVMTKSPVGDVWEVYAIPAVIPGVLPKKSMYMMYLN